MNATHSTTGNASSKQHLVFGQVNDGGISPRKLHVLGVLHNFVVKRSDGRTAANRFFGQNTENYFHGSRKEDSA